MSTVRTLMKLALAACARGDAEAARELLRGALTIEEDPAPAAGAALPRALSLEHFAKVVLDCTPRHVRNLITRGEIPPDAVLGAGRGRRILVEPALEALRASKRERRRASAIAREGAEHVRGRARLRVVHPRNDSRSTTAPARADDEPKAR
jgi:hypothetical protein